MMERLTASAANLWPGSMTASQTDDPSPTTVPFVPGEIGANLPRIPGYEILGELGRGGMGVVYRARQLSLNRLVALKMILPGGVPSAAVVQRLRKEAEVIATLDHPSIVPLYEVGEHGGQPFLTMKLFEGGSLSECLDRFPTNPRLAAEVVADLAEAIAHAHERGILHRDLKPSNVLLDREGRPRLTDFGLAKHLHADGGLTHSGELIGTPNYMAPEQADSPPITTPATDVYGLGAILYTMLTRKLPFQGVTVLDTLEQVKNRDPEPPSQSNRLVRRELVTICLKCLQKEPSHRYSSAKALENDLRCWLAGKPIVARPVGPLVRCGKWCRRNPRLAVLGAAVAVLVLIVVVGLTTGLSLLHKKQQETVKALEQSDRNWARLHDVLSQTLQRLEGRDLAGKPEIQEFRENLTQQALKIYSSLIEHESESLHVQFQAAQTYLFVASLHRGRGDMAKMEEAYQNAIATLEKLAAEFPQELGYWNAVGQAHHILALELAVRGGRSEDVTKECRRAGEAYRRALELDPNQDGSLNYSSWFAAICPDEQFRRDPKIGVALAEKLVRLYPNVGHHWTNLGVACYRAGDWQGALDALHRSMKGRPEGETSYDTFFLAMAHERLGEKQKARQFYDRAIGWMEKSRPSDHELRLFRAEATRELGMTPAIPHEHGP
jgi:tetratricopeptide (TPR) repeat protein